MIISFACAQSFSNTDISTMKMVPMGNPWKALYRGAVRTRNVSYRPRPIDFLLPTLGILVIAGFLLFWKLGVTSFRNGDEAMYAQCAREMTERGDYLTPYYRGEPFLEKPPLKFWLITLGYRVWGISEMGARFSSALFALGTVALTIVFGRLLFGAATGLLGGVILISSTQFIHEHCGRTAEMEPETAFLYVASMICLWLAQRDRRWLYALAGSLGILTMIKGPLVVPALVMVALFLRIVGSHGIITRRAMIISILIFLGIALPWHIHQLMVNGELFTKVYLRQHILRRFTGRSLGGSTRPVVGLGPKASLRFYLYVILSSLFPWSLIVLPALVHQCRAALRRSSNAQRSLLIWILAFSAFVCLSRGKLPWYVVPILPALALSVAHFCRSLYGLRPRWLFFGILIVALVLSALLVLSPQYDPHQHRAIAWPRQDPSLIGLWDIHGPVALSLLPSIATLILVVAAIITLRVSRRARFHGNARRALWFVLLGSFLFSGLYRVALPMRNVEYRRESARCSDAVRAAGIHPERIAFLGPSARRYPKRATDRFYLYSLGSTEFHSLGPNLDAPTVAEILRCGTLIVADHEFHEALSERILIQPLWSGDCVDAFYIDDS